MIRHRHDFGAVVLADERFAHGNVRNQLSVWLRPAVQPFDSFGKAAAKLTQFFKHHAGDRPRLKPAAEPNRDLKHKDDAGAKFETLGGGGGGGGGIAAKFGAGGSHTRGGGGGMGLLGKLAGGQFAVDGDAAEICCAWDTYMTMAGDAAASVADGVSAVFISMRDADGLRANGALATPAPNAVTATLWDDSADAFVSWSAIAIWALGVATCAYLCRCRR